MHKPIAKDRKNILDGIKSSAHCARDRNTETYQKNHPREYPHLGAREGNFPVTHNKISYSRNYTIIINPKIILVPK